MKTKLFLGALCCILLVSLIGFAIAGNTAWPEGLSDLIWVKFAGDPMQQHGRQVASWCVYASPGTSILVTTIPSNKKFIVTDVIMYDSVKAYLSTDLDTTDVKFRMPYNGTYIGIRSGVVFGPGESIYLKITAASSHVTISGYYVDLP